MTDLLSIVVGLQAEVGELRRRIEQTERELIDTRQGASRAALRRMTLEEAGRRGVLPRCPRTIRGWLATAESRAIWKTDLFARRLGRLIEIDLNGLEEWRRQMAAPTTPAWPKRWNGKSERSPQ